MDHRKLRRRLRRLASAANARFPRLNYGGCCVFAAAVATELEKHGVKHEVITSGDKYTDLNELRPTYNSVDAWNDVGVGFGHVGVRLKLGQQWYTYDSERPLMRGKHYFGQRLLYDEPYRAAKGGLTATEATELADEADKWNHEFGRYNVGPVREMVKEYLS